MLFNSNEFLFGFLPVTLCGFYLLGSISRTGALRWLILASLAFYAWWRPINVLIIGPSILINFALARLLLRFNQGDGLRRASNAILLLGISFNVLFLAIFKYTDFLFSTVNDVLGANLVLTHIILPLGVSFITFQKIAFLIDVQAGRVRSFTFQDYCTFVLFFPQLIAGPIVHYREMMPQFHAAACRFDKQNVAIGLTLLLFGLFKKVVLADKIAFLVTPIMRLPRAERLYCWRGWQRSASPCSSILTFPAIPTWRLDWPGSSGLGCHRTSTRRFVRRASLIFGCAGI
jgi:alginate O-acetyltransferase complex protein AlgI